jgi:uncharacterized protein YdhG (YjbR/CyaY superfamily)
MTSDEGSKSIDAYIATFPQDVQVKLNALRKLIRELAPDATEKISYRIPTFYLHGNLVHYAAYPKHIGFYPTSSGIAEFEEELANYKHAKGSVQFPLDRPLPMELIARIVKFRLQENLAGT